MESTRRASLDDLDDLEVLATEGDEHMRALRGGLLWSLTLGHRAPLRDSLAARVTDPDQLTLVGCIDDVVVGYGNVRLEPLADGRPLGVVTELFVTAAARGVGVGEVMMDELLAWCTARGCVGIDAVALPGDRDTKNFFETFGLTARAIVVHRTLAAPDE
jgi:GNAT superfamily N-acetyltransferase